jgi:hypothetical protein
VPLRHGKQQSLLEPDVSAKQRSASAAPQCTSHVQGLARRRLARLLLSMRSDTLDRRPGDVSADPWLNVAYAHARSGRRDPSPAFGDTRALNWRKGVPRYVAEASTRAA